MDILFVHNNFPAQFRNLAAALALYPQMRVAAIGARGATTFKGCDLHRYSLPSAAVAGTHPFARRFDLECRRAEQVLYAATALARSGFSPQTIFAHSGWGEGLILREAFPRARIIMYCEFYYRADGLDVDFDPEFPTVGIDGRVALHLKNSSTLLSLVDCDEGLTPTIWQRSTFPAELQSKLAVIHEGIDTGAMRPDAQASYTTPSGVKLDKTSEVVTYVARNLEPLRGFHVFMRSLPEILRRRPEAHIVIVGGDQISYGSRPPPGQSWRGIFTQEVAKHIDLKRVHFVGRVPYSTYTRILQISRVHVYLTYPFVLSWSLLEAMSAGCLIIGSATGPVQEVVDENNGLLVPFFDFEGLAAKTCAALAKPEQFSSYREAARTTIQQRFAIEGCVGGLVKKLLG